MHRPEPPPPSSGARLRGQTLRLAASLLVGLLVMLITGLIGMALTRAVLWSLAAAIVFWLCWLVAMRMWLRMNRHRS